KEGEAVLVLADHYPDNPEKLEDSFFQLIEEKQLRAYIEFPSHLPDISVEGIEKGKAERAVVNSNFFGGFPDSLAILGINGLHYLKMDVKNSPLHLVAARVAGFDSAIFGLPETIHPLLFELKGLPVLVATASLSRFLSGRYAPSGEWEAVWRNVLEYLLPGACIEELKWNPVVEPTYFKYDTLPDNVQQISYTRGIEWYKNARMLIPSSYKDTLSNLVDVGIQRLEWNASIPVGDGSDGVFECLCSDIDEKGNQSIGIMQRGDCISETAMAFATVGRIQNNKEYLKTAQNLLDYYLLNSPATRNEYGDPEHGAYGLIPWGISNYAWYKASYGDDNARFLMAALITAAFTENGHWDEILLKSLLALLRTTGRNGFRGSRIDLDEFEKNGWQYYFNREITNLSPHFECYLWACYLWAYDKTGDALFLKRAQNGIHTMMDNYPDNWHWTNGLAQERARMILPLAWLVRVSDTRENREMLFAVVTDFLKLQDECGAIREELGDIAQGKYPPPQSNEEYGITEASLIAQNGDPVSDLLYTTNFAFLGLHEAFYATNDPDIKEANDKLAEFLCRIQVKSESHPEVDGGWMRAFDYKRFGYWGSNADHGWGAWAIETGWTQGWITTVMALRDLDSSVWDVTKDSQIDTHYKSLRKEMLPGMIK
ncbi:MAG: hypothetical protein JXA72_03025, partial [Bacteroidales bacterium]|nr:hypothetical protein [Bacteroidales bacterium]